MLNKNNLFDRIYTVDISLLGDKKDFIKKDIELNKNSEPFLMIGDREADIIAGKENNLKTIFCNYGYGETPIADITINKSEDLFTSIIKLM